MKDPLLLNIEKSPLPDVEKVYDFYVTTAGGLEDVVLRELRQHLKQITRVRVKKGRRRGRIFFHYRRSPHRLLELHCVETVYALLADFGGVTVGQPGLLAIAKQIGKVDLIPAAVLHDILHGIKEEAHFHLSCTVGKGHRFSASELRYIVQTVLTMRYDLELGDESVPYQIQVQVQGRRALIGMQLSTQEQKKRSYREIEVNGDLPPAVAYCIGKLARIQKQQICLDVRCGGGTTLIEQGTENDRNILVGIEAYPEVVMAAAHNAHSGGVNLHLAVADPEAFCIQTGAADRLICNLMRRKGEPPIGLMSLFSEIARVLKKGGEAVVIAEGRDIMKQALGDIPPLRLAKRQPLHLRGRHPDIYFLQKC